MPKVALAYARASFTAASAAYFFASMMEAN